LAGDVYPKILVILISLFLCSIAIPSLAQRQFSPALQAFVAKDYAAYLAAAPGELAGMAERPQAAFEAMLPTAIALEKTAGWDGENEKQIAIRGQVMYFLENLCYNISRR